ncbi:enoyl-CoA hydratase [Novosphingobium sp. KN65.2]|uniref:enoyl-CoA hydratase n=2 Tax=Sphingomonadaceae TaxID=41297 RepID=UPI0018D179A0|nr:enoyl-CoA hydratase [Novosphingobium sp. KN65.2]
MERAAMSDDKLLVEREGPLAWITFNNPAKHNAISLDMWRALGRALEGIAQDREVRCILLRGAGERAFVSGADISEFAGQRRSPKDVAAYDEAADHALGLLQSTPQPSVAMISGYCFGGGVAIALSCDIRIAGSDALFSVPAARLGLGYGWLGTRKLLDVVGPAWAADMLFSARRYGATEALAMGLITQFHPVAELQAQVGAYASTIAENAPLTIQAAKTIIKELSRPSGNADLALCDRLVAECFASEDYAEGAQAFAAKRKPRFVGR